MPQTNGHEDSRPRKPNWVEIGTLVVLSLTLVAVIIYACEAHHQNELTRESIELTSRPYLAVSVQEGGAGFRLTTANDGSKRSPNTASVTFVIVNNGKFPAVTMLRSGAFYTKTKPPESNTEYLPTSEEPNLIFPSSAPTQTWTAYDAGPLSDGDLVDLRKSGGYLRVIIRARYGPSYKYATRVCEEFRLKATDDGQLRLFDGVLCPHASESNYAR